MKSVWPCYVCLYVCVCSIAESDSCYDESALDESDMNEVGMAVTRFVTRFIDKVCTESNVRADHVRQLHQMIPGHSLPSDCLLTYYIMHLIISHNITYSFINNWQTAVTTS